ncbi:hypothetical protein J6590_019344 [Homalodisca vitripennis]|nr:hypothetical protein J6590_019344 [Homalodisca vitripennis]
MSVSASEGHRVTSPRGTRPVARRLHHLARVTVLSDRCNCSHSTFPLSFILHPDSPMTRYFSDLHNTFLPDLNRSIRNSWKPTELQRSGAINCIPPLQNAFPTVFTVINIKWALPPSPEFQEFSNRSTRPFSGAREPTTTLASDRLTFRVSSNKGSRHYVTPQTYRVVPVVYHHIRTPLSLTRPNWTSGFPLRLTSNKPITLLSDRRRTTMR